MSTSARRASRSSDEAGLYPQVGGSAAQREQMAMLWVLNQSDGHHSLLDVAQRSALQFSDIRIAAHRLHEAGLLAPAEGVV